MKKGVRLILTFGELSDLITVQHQNLAIYKKALKVRGDFKLRTGKQFSEVVNLRERRLKHFERIMDEMWPK